MDNGKSESVTKKIKVYGIVQGVGFRPLVYRIAQKFSIRGTVRNVGGYAEIIAQGSEKTLGAFIKEIKDIKGRGCEIMKLEAENIEAPQLNSFIIIGSRASEEVSIIPPDLVVCPDCTRELYMDSDRRFQNPFISCMSCGPRYTIIEELPYDRNNTSMRDFSMCEACRKEYTSPDNRRFHAQTISCNDCGPYLIFKDRAMDLKPDNNMIEAGNLPEINQVLSSSVTYDSKMSANKEAFEKAVFMIKAGGIIAVKGIGGYHFVCSPFMEETVVKLRRLKGREEKPFAVMFPSIEEIENYCKVSEEEKSLLLTNARPIVLLYRRRLQDMAPSTNKLSICCGAFLPYTPLQLMLTRECGPLIMTSANISDRPIIREDDEILSVQSPYLGGILYNTRRIVRSVEDSVAKVIDKKPQLIRRSRGYVPYPVFLTGNSKRAIFAAGGDLKAAYCLYDRGKAVVSQYFGDLEEESVMEEYKKSYTDLSRLLMITPDLAVCDLHPNYHSARFAKELNIPVLEVQHHHAHIASVIAEHDLKGKVIGVAFDGTGYGTDGNIWGGEFLICEGAHYTRAAHLCYNLILGGDQSMRDTQKTATCYLMNAGLDDYVRDDRKTVIRAALTNRINTVLTSSMGRLFDAAASILGLGDDNRYEGECAALLEKEAVLAIQNDLQAAKFHFAFSEINEIIEIDTKPVLEALCRGKSTISTGALALGFHYAIADAVGEVLIMLRERYHSNIVALSGGVFQNTVLTELTLQILRQKKFEVYFNISVPPNDGAISLGQTYIGLHQTKPGSRPNN